VTKELEFDFRHGEETFLALSIHTRSALRPLSYLYAQEAAWPRSIELTTHLHLVPRMRMVEIHLLSSTSPHDVLDQFKYKENLG
jgi:hypothetical protein